MSKNTGSSNGSVWGGVGLVIASLAGLWMVDRGMTKRTSIKASAMVESTQIEGKTFEATGGKGTFSEKRVWHPAVVVGGFTGRS